MEFIICHAEVSIAFVEEAKIPEVFTFMSAFENNMNGGREIMTVFTYILGFLDYCKVFLHFYCFSLSEQ